MKLTSIFPLVCIYILAVSAFQFDSYISPHAYRASEGTTNTQINNFVIVPEVAVALKEGKPVVALESTVISHGMPYPANYETGIELENVVRENGAVPATIAILKGTIHVGLNSSSLLELAQLGSKAVKTSKREIALVSSLKQTGATTVSATSWIAAQVGIEVFATGGIGGVHRFAESTMDISADLTELAHTRMAVVCAGVKSILDIGRTLEYLETQGVPVIGYDTNEFPAFFTPKSGFPVTARLNNSLQCAELIDTAAKLNMPHGIVVAVPVPEGEAAEFTVVEEATQKALKESETQKILGKDVTPFLLKRISELTQGASLKANIALIKNNARVAALIASELSTLRSGLKPSPAVIQESNSNTIENTNYPVVIGGMVLDFISQSADSLVEGTSNPGKASSYSGGVARNVVETLSRLNQTVFFVSAVGQDMSGHTLWNHLQGLNPHLPKEGIMWSNLTGTAVYSAILDNDGEMKVAVADMDIFDLITPAYVRQFQNKLESAPMILLDGNLPKATIETALDIAHKKQIDVVFEPTSVPKSEKIADNNILQSITYITPNIDELVHVVKTVNPSFELESDNIQELSKLCAEVLSKGVKHVILKLGARGVLLATSTQQNSCKSSQLVDSFVSNDYYYYHFAAIPVEKIVSVTGAGDSLVGGMVKSLLSGSSLCESIHVGLKAAKLTLESVFAVSEQMNSLLEQ